MPSSGFLTAISSFPTFEPVSCTFSIVAIVTLVESFFFASAFCSLSFFSSTLCSFTFSLLTTSVFSACTDSSTFSSTEISPSISPISSDFSSSSLSLACFCSSLRLSVFASLNSSDTVVLKPPPRTPPDSKNWSTLLCKSFFLSRSFSAAPFLSKVAITFPVSSMLPIGLSAPFALSITLPNKFTVMFCLLISFLIEADKSLAPRSTCWFTGPDAPPATPPLTMF